MNMKASEVSKQNRDLEAAHRGSKSAVDRIVMRQRAYIEAIKPYVNQKAKIYSTTLPITIIHPDGEVENKYNFNEAQKINLRLIDEAIEAIKAQFTGA